LQGRAEEGGTLLVASISALLEMDDSFQAKNFTGVFFVVHRDATNAPKTNVRGDLAQIRV
jgi:hypothetical protein